jgi:hypothetical protein
MRLSAWIPRSASVSAALAILAGCATPSGDSVATPPDRALLVRPGRAGFVVAARADRSAGATAIARDIAEHTGFGLVVAPRSSGGDTARQRAQALERGATEAARGPLRFLVELTEAERPPCAGRMDIATIGVDTELAARLRALAELIRDAHLRVNPEVARLGIVVDAGDEGAAAPPTDARAPTLGAALRPERALSIELPPCARRDWRAMYGAVLADFVAQAAVLPAGR